jgi:beta-lactam-binding protein with PASTA domain
MRKFFRFVLMAMVLLTVALMSALTAMRIAIHGRETTIPNFVKLSPRDAERMAARNGLAVIMQGEFYSSDIPEGHIVSQMPPPGTRVRRGWRVRLAQSLGPQRVVIPSVLGESQRAAELNVRQRGLELGTVAQLPWPNEEPGQVIAQTPPPNAIGVQSPKVNVLIATPPPPQRYVMPNFVGRPLSEVTASIQQAGFKLGEVVEAQTAPSASNGTASPSKGTNPAVVIRQHPEAGQKVTQDTPIDLEVSH